VTTLLDDTEVLPVPPVASSRRPRPAAVLPWLIPAALLVAGLLKTGTPARAVALYAAYLAFAVVLPGTLVHRALRGTRGNLPEDLGLGTATGFVVLLTGWALAAATSLQALLPGWPALVVVLFLAVPRLRRHWRIAPADLRPLPVLWSWIVAGALVLVILAAYTTWRSNPLPPTTAAYYQDLLYHLALVHEMTRSMPFQVPQLAGDLLRYHYLSDADIAVGSMVTGIAPATVLLRLWLVPVAATTVLVSAALARQVSGKWWAGAIGGAASVAVLPVSLGTAVTAMGGGSISILSPSETYSLPLVGLLITILVDVLRGRPIGWAWAMVFPLAVACAGAKTSSLPPVVAGLLLAGLVVVLRYRDRLRATLIVSGTVLAAMLVGARLFAGGGAGTTSLQPLQILYWFAPYRNTIGSRDVIDSSLELPAGVAHASTAGAIFIAGVVVWWLLMQAPRLLGLAALGTGGARTDPAAWLLAGVVSSAVAAAFLLWHPSASQMYFFIGAIPFGSVLTAWLLADRARGPRAVLAGLAAGLLAGALWFAADPKPKAPRHTIAAWSWELVRPVLITAVVAAAVAGLALLVWRRRTGRTAWKAVPVALVAAVLAAGLTTNLRNTAKDVYVTTFRPLPKPPAAQAVTRDEMVAALWLDKHAGKDDIVATNVHCLQMVWKVCDARAFWVAGLGGRRTLIESWGYSDQAVAADGVNGLRYSRQPPPYPDRFAVNQRAFAQGDAADVAELRTKYHVRWLFGDSRAVGGVSPALAGVATLRYTSGPVTVYELAP
jgi:hypothetical protein